MTDSNPTGRPQTMWLAGYIQQYKEEILADWETSIRALPVTRELSRLALRDHLPALLTRIAEMAATIDDPQYVSIPPQPAIAHANAMDAVPELSHEEEPEAGLPERGDSPLRRVEHPRVLDRVLDSILAEHKGPEVRERGTRRKEGNCHSLIQEDANAMPSRWPSARRRGLRAPSAPGPRRRE